MDGILVDTWFHLTGDTQDGTLLDVEFHKPFFGPVSKGLQIILEDCMVMRAIYFMVNNTVISEQCNV